MTRYRRLVIISCFLLSLFCIIGYAGGGEGSSSTEESIPVELRLKGTGNVELFILRKDGRTYLPMIELFKFLRVNLNVSADRRNIQGFFLSKDTAYTIDFDSHIASIRGRRITISDDLFVISTQDIYIDTELLFEIFGIKSDYNARRLTVTLTTTREMPVVSIAKRQKRRETMFQTQQIPTPSMYLDRSPFFFGGARLDYRFNTVAVQHRKPTHNYLVGFGAHVLGGDLQATLRGVISKKINENNVSAFIRYPFFDGDIVRQIIIGDIPPGIEPLYIGTVRGIEVTNRPAPRRLTLATEAFTIDAPGSQEVELYQGGRLLSYSPGVPDGIYKFNLGIPYGNADVELRAYDEWGGLEIQRYRFNVSQLMVPPGEFQYSVKGGELRRYRKDYYGKARVDYGVSSSLTVGLDAQYVDIRDDGQQFYPAITAEAALRVTPGILGEFAFSPLLASKFLLNGSFPSQAYITFAHYWYKRSSALNLSKAIEQTNLAVNVPFYFTSYGIVFNVQADQSIYEALRRRAILPRIEGYTRGFRVSLSMNIGRIDYSSTSKSDFWTTRLSTSVRAPFSLVVALAAQYDHKAKKMQNVQITASRAIGTRLLLIASYNRSWLPSYVSAFLQVSYDLPFLRIDARGMRVDNEYQYNQVLTGSILTSATLSDFFFDNRLRLGRAAIYFRPFLDQNSSGALDGGERYLPDITVKTFGPQVIGVGYKTREGLLIPNAEAYQYYIGYVPKQSYEDPHWIARYGAVSVRPDPNVLKMADLPIVIGGIVNGRVTQTIGGKPAEGTEGVTVTISDGTFSMKTRTFSTGEFSFIGVPPGRYVVSIARDELVAAGLRPVQSELNIEVRTRPEGDIIDNVNFEVVER
ncbi:MAG: hypothetical protein EPO24_10980 [Bacteroidetes bacterium]|nr:MAG: hypothetical protein EPO24_10980 [Bacteroidota bacterium]